MVSGNRCSLVQNCARLAENMRGAQRRQTRDPDGSDERSARGRMRPRFTSGPTSGLSLSSTVSLVDRAISWYTRFCCEARSAGEAVKTGNVGKMALLKSRKVGRGDRQTAHLGRSAFMLTCAGKVSWRCRHLCCWDVGAEIGRRLVTGNAGHAPRPQERQRARIQSSFEFTVASQLKKTTYYADRPRKRTTLDASNCPRSRLVVAAPSAILLGLLLMACSIYFHLRPLN